VAVLEISRKGAIDEHVKPRLISQGSKGQTMRVINLRKIMRRRVITLAIIGVLILGVTTWSLRAIQNRLTVENLSGQPITLLMIGVYGSSSSFMFENIPDGGKASRSFSVDQDGGFYVHGFLADGTSISGGDFGYVTNGMFGEHAQFVVKQGGGLDFSQGKD
jgi:uncharacterized membrane protein YwzB